MGRNKENNQKMKDERREQILSHALMLFATKGLAATKISDICSTAGFSQGLVYHYYRSKEDIFVELISNAFKKLNTACRGLESLEVSPREKIIIAIEKLLQGLEESKESAWYYLLTTQANILQTIPVKAKAVIRKQRDVPYEIITRIILEGQKDGSIKQYDAKELALVFWTSIIGLAIYKATHGNKIKVPDAQILTNMFV